MNLPSIQPNQNLIFLDQAQTIECAKRLEGRENFDQLVNIIMKVTQVVSAIIITLASSPIVLFMGFSATTSFLTIAAIFTISNFILKATIDYIEDIHHPLELSAANKIIHDRLGVYPSEGIRPRIYNYSFNPAFMRA